jgi:hypothetical protein
MSLKIEDGSNAFVSQLLNGDTQDANGNKLDFQPASNDNRHYTAQVPLNDGTNRIAVYTFSIPDPTVVVSREVKEGR